jgi:hypothetical protein
VAFTVVQIKAKVAAGWFTTDTARLDLASDLDLLAFCLRALRGQLFEAVVV